jgi:hypothetical protein
MTASLFAALAITIIVEALIAAAILRRFLWIESIAVQCTTWPVAQWLLWRTGKFWPIELGVIVAETLLWRIVVPMSWRRAVVVSSVANAVTAVIALFFWR